MITHPPSSRWGCLKFPQLSHFLFCMSCNCSPLLNPQPLKTQDQVPTSSRVPSIGLLQWHCNLFELFTVLTLFKHLWQNHAGVMHGTTLTPAEFVGGCLTSCHFVLYASSDKLLASSVELHNTSYLFCDQIMDTEKKIQRAWCI